MSDIEKNEHDEMTYRQVYAKLTKLILSDLAINDKTNVLFNTYTKEQVAKWLEKPTKYQKQIRNVSIFLYTLSPHYKRLCDYFAEMARFDWYIEPYNLNTATVNVKIFQEEYKKRLHILDNMEIKHEFTKVLKNVYREGVFYGYEYETDDSYMIQKLDPDYCEIVAMVDGIYTFAFNVTYFNSSNVDINTYAPEFKRLYKDYLDAKEDKSVSRKDLNNYIWRTLSVEKSVCIKTNDEVALTFPPFVGVIADIYDIQEYKMLKKANETLQNYAFFVGQMPFRKDEDARSEEPFKLGMDTAIAYGNKIQESLPDQMGFVLSPYEKLDFVKSSNNSVGTDKVEESVNNFWLSAGVSKDLFGTGANTEAAVARSIGTDAQGVFKMLRQIERYVNRKLKNLVEKEKYKFKFNILDTTELNIDAFVTRELKAATYGTPNKTRVGVALGMSQSSLESMAFLENEVLKFTEKWQPLQSSNTMSGDSPTNGENGRPTKEQTSKSGGDD